MTGEHNLRVITRNRTALAPNGRQYCGLALVTNLATSNFKEYELLNPEEFEILACVGTVRGIKGKVFVIA